MRRLALPHQRLAQPDRGRNKDERHQYDDGPGELGYERLRPEGVQHFARFATLGQDKEGERKHEKRAANSHNITH